MDKIIVFHLEQALPLYRIDGNVSLKIHEGNEFNESSSFETDLDLSKDDIQVDYDDRHNEEGSNTPDWVTKQMELGEFGEKIALAFLRDHHEHVELVSGNSRIGYDIEIIQDRIEHGYEIKTSCAHLHFHISYNELKIASKMRDNYSIFFLNISPTEQKAVGFIINDPIAVFSIDFQEITKGYTTNNFRVEPSSFRIILEKDFLSQYVEIDLSHYIGRIS